MQSKQPDTSLAVSAVLLLVLVLSVGVSASETVRLTSGRALSVRSHRAEPGAVVLTLSSGEEVRCAPSIVAKITGEPDAAARRDAPLTPGDPPPAYVRLIEKAAAKAGIDPKLVRAVIQVESGFRPLARSPEGAMGLMQIMPEIAQRYAVRNPYDPAANIEAGIKHLKSLLDRFDLSVALAAYNAGEGAVDRFQGIPPYPTTRSYVSAVLRLLVAMTPSAGRSAEGW